MFREGSCIKTQKHTVDEYTYTVSKLETHIKEVSYAGRQAWRDLKERTSCQPVKSTHTHIYIHTSRASFPSPVDVMASGDLRLI